MIREMLGACAGGGTDLQGPESKEGSFTGTIPAKMRWLKRFFYVSKNRLGEEDAREAAEARRTGSNASGGGKGKDSIVLGFGHRRRGIA